MSRDTSPLIVGDYWLDKRRDGIAPNIWQIATYKSGSRTVIYRSTKCRDVTQAGEILRSFEAAQRSHGPQETHEAELLPHLFNYIREHGPDVKRLDTIKSSFRAWIGFLQQDELGTDARVADINKVSVTRFRRWRMEPHGWEVDWGGKLYKWTSQGVSGEAVQRNIEDLRSALNHAEAANRIPMRPRIPSVDKKLRSKPRDLIFTPAQLGMIVAYAEHDKPAQQWIRLMLATAVRPDAGLAFNPANQWRGNVIDLHPQGWDETDKRNPLVPVIEPLWAVLEAWEYAPVISRKTFWRTMRDKLGVDAAFVPKTIRHTVASHLRNSSVPGEQISALLGHKDRSDTLERTSERYAHSDPLKMREAIRALTNLYSQVEAEAARWSADHLLTITPDNNKEVTARKAVKV
jgi:integrase